MATRSSHQIVATIFLRFDEQEETRSWFCVYFFCVCCGRGKEIGSHVVDEARTAYSVHTKEEQCGYVEYGMFASSQWILTRLPTPPTFHLAVSVGRHQ